MADVPGYWMHETSGTLAPVVRRYLAGRELDAGELDTMRAYLRQWVGGAFVGPGVAELRRRVDRIASTAEPRAWMADAFAAGIDPL